MSLHFVVILAGQEETVALRNGMTIGRQRADIVVDDPTVSSKHASVRQDPSGIWSIVDLGSRNAINFEGRKVKSLTLKPGVTFSIGRAIFKTIEVEKTNYTSSQIGVEVAPETWHEKIARVAQKISASAPNELSSPDQFPNLVALEFVSGIQTNTRWVMGYGPRVVGSEIPEFTVLEEGAPAICFKLSSDAKGIVFQTDYPAKVLLNGKPTKTDLVRQGDEIYIGQTKIRVGFA